jgi:hypothetical protein
LSGVAYSFSSKGAIFQRDHGAYIFIGIIGMSILRHLIIAVIVVNQIGRSEYYACTNDVNELCSCEENKRTGKLVIRCPTGKDLYLFEQSSERRKKQRYEKRQTHEVHWVNGIPIATRKREKKNVQQKNTDNSDCYDSGWLRVCPD